jgi:hypothetical protein
MDVTHDYDTYRNKIRYWVQKYWILAVGVIVIMCISIYGYTTFIKNNQISIPHNSNAYISTLHTLRYVNVSSGSHLQYEHEQACTQKRPYDKTHLRRLKNKRLYVSSSTIL